MIEFESDYYDGQSAQGHRAHARQSGRALEVTVGDRVHRFAFAHLDIAPRLGDLKRAIGLPDGARLETSDNPAVDALVVARGDDSGNAFIHRLESRLGTALLALVVSVGLVFAGMKYGLPRLAQSVAERIPPEIETSLGEQTLGFLDRGLFSPTRLPPARRAALATRLESLCRSWGRCPGYRLEFRDSARLGANALALPGGTVVVTDALVALARRDDEIVAVMTHELGHVAGRHTLRHALSSTAVVLIVSTVTGDITSLSGLAAGLPTVLLEMRYAREFEREADGYALAALQAACIPPRRFADMLARLTPPAGTEVASFLSTHPDTEARVEPFLRAAPCAAPKGRGGRRAGQALIQP